MNEIAEIQIETIIWDWNGTLLNDKELCVQSINKLLHDRSLPELSMDRYLNVFGFPVIDYYKRIGFNFDHEPFEIPANQFIEHYSSGINNCNLFSEVNSVLSSLHEMGIQQMVLSAMEQIKLEQSIANLNIDHYFEKISGLNHDYATTKEENGIRMIEENDIQTGKTVLIGDTTHDFEVAQRLNCRCILIAQGHQHKSILEQTGATVLNSLDKLPEIICGNR